MMNHKTFSSDMLDMAANPIPAFHPSPHKPKNDLETKVDNLNSTYDAEASKQAHGSSDCRQFCLKISLFILCDKVKSWGSKVDIDPVEFCLSFKTLEKYYIIN